MSDPKVFLLEQLLGKLSFQRQNGCKRSSQQILRSYYVPGVIPVTKPTLSRSLARETDNNHDTSK